MGLGGGKGRGKCAVLQELLPVQTNVQQWTSLNQLLPSVGSSWCSLKLQLHANAWQERDVLSAGPGRSLESKESRGECPPAQQHLGRGLGRGDSSVRTCSPQVLIRENEAQGEVPAPESPASCWAGMPVCHEPRALAFHKIAERIQSPPIPIPGMKA